jgi:hypothetical protein
MAPHAAGSLRGLHFNEDQGQELCSAVQHAKQILALKYGCTKLDRLCTEANRLPCVLHPFASPSLDGAVIPFSIKIQLHRLLARRHGRIASADAQHLQAVNDVSNNTPSCVHIEYGYGPFFLRAQKEAGERGRA